MESYADWKNGVNRKYYKKVGREYRKDFSTLAADIGLPWGKRFHCSGPCNVLEMGPGDGSLAKAFLGALDERTYGNVTYYIHDFSRKMLRDALENLGEHRGKVKVYKGGVKFDRIHYCELWDDLRTERYLLLRGKTYRLYVKNGQLEFLPYKVSKKRYLVEGYSFPFHIGAVEEIKEQAGMLKEKGEIFSVDYGFRKELLKKRLNRCIERQFEQPRRYGNQITDDVYFDFILDQARKLGLKANINGIEPSQLMGFFELQLRRIK